MVRAPQSPESTVPQARPYEETKEPQHRPSLSERYIPTLRHRGCIVLRLQIAGRRSPLSAPMIETRVEPDIDILSRTFQVVELLSWIDLSEFRLFRREVLSAPAWSSGVLRQESIL